MISQGIIVVLRDHETPTPYVELWVGRVRDHGRFGDDSFINRDDWCTIYQSVFEVSKLGYICMDIGCIDCVEKTV